MKTLYSIFAFLFAATVLMGQSFAEGVSVFDANDSQKKAARAAYKKGRAAIDRKYYQAALKHFRDSHNIIASPNSRMYIVVALQQLGRLSEAYWEALATVEDAKLAAKSDAKYENARVKAQESADAIARENAIVELKVNNPQKGAQLFLNGRPVAKKNWKRPFVVAPGIVTIRFGNQPALKLNTRGGGRYPIDLASGTAVEAGAKPMPAPTPAEGEATASRGKFFWPGVITAGAGGLTLIAAAALGGAASGVHSDLEASCLGGPCGPEFNDKIDRGSRLQTASNVTLTLGLLAVAAGGTLIAFDVWSPGNNKENPTAARKTQPRARLRIGPTHMQLGVTF